MRAIASITPSDRALAARPRVAQSGSQGATPTEPAQPGRALVPVGSGQAVADAAGSRPLAAFLAHLIATAQQAPQTRQRRRAEPNEASAIYAAVSAPAARRGRAVCHSL